MSPVARAFPAFFRAAVLVMLTYRGEIILWAVWGLVNPAVLYAVWSSAVQGSADGVVAGFDRGQFAAYYFVIMIVGHLTAAWDVHQMGYLVRTGRLSAVLLRPILPVWDALAQNLAYKVTSLAFLVPMWALFAWVVTPTFSTAPWQFGLGTVALFLGAVLNFVLGYLIALVAFWTTKLDAVGQIYFGLGMFLGGRFAPLSALPQEAYWCAAALPFRWMFAFPTELLIGRLASRADALTGIAVQLVWIAGVLVAFRFLWVAAVKRYTAVSG